MQKLRVWMLVWTWRRPWRSMLLAVLVWRLIAAWTCVGGRWKLGMKLRLCIAQTAIAMLPYAQWNHQSNVSITVISLVAIGLDQMQLAIRLVC